MTEPPTVEDLMEAGFTGDDLIDELIQRGTAWSREDAEFQIAVTVDGDTCTGTIPDESMTTTDA